MEKIDETLTIQMQKMLIEMSNKKLKKKSIFALSSYVEILHALLILIKYNYKCRYACVLMERERTNASWESVLNGKTNHSKTNSKSSNKNKFFLHKYLGWKLNLKFKSINQTEEEEETKWILILTSFLCDISSRRAK